MGLKTIPILPSADFDVTSKYYAALGFQEMGRWPDEYLTLRAGDGLELHFWFNPQVERYTNDVACYVRFDSAAEAQALHDRWAALQLPLELKAPEKTDYGLLEFALIDPHGNLLRIGG